jgi:hypothetical protein
MGLLKAGSCRTTLGAAKVRVDGGGVGGVTRVFLWRGGGGVSVR